MVLEGEIAFDEVSGGGFVAWPEVGWDEVEFFGRWGILPEGVEGADVKKCAGFVGEACREHARGNML